MAFAPVVEFIGAWNGNTNKGTLILRKPNNSTETLTQLGLQKFILFLTMLQGAHTIYFDDQTDSFRTGAADVDG